MQQVAAREKTLGAAPSLGTQSGAGGQGASGQVPLRHHPWVPWDPKVHLSAGAGWGQGTGPEGCTEPQPSHAWAEVVCIAPDLQFITCITVACSLPGLV